MTVAFITLIQVTVGNAKSATWNHMEFIIIHFFNNFVNKSVTLLSQLLQLLLLLEGLVPATHNDVRTSE